MSLKRRAVLFGGALVFSLSILLGIALTLGIAWPNLEAALYFTKWTSAPLHGLECPFFLTAAQGDVIQLTVKNPTPRTLQVRAQATFSRTIFREESQTIELSPGAKGQIVWPVSAEDVDWGLFAFADVLLFPIASEPFRQANCGILYLDIPWLSGRQVYALALGICLAGILGGLVMVWANPPRSRRGQEVERWMRVLSVIVLMALLVSSLGMWFFGIILLAATVLMVSMFLYLLVSQSDSAG